MDALKRGLVAGWLPLLALGLWLYAPVAEGGFVFCAFRRATGVPCPGCGMTRALAHLLHGEWGAALRFHPFALPTATLLVIGWLYGMGAVFYGKRFSRRVEVTVGILYAMVLVGVWVWRLIGFTYAGMIPPEFR